MRPDIFASERAVPHDASPSVPRAFTNPLATPRDFAPVNRDVVTHAPRDFAPGQHRLFVGPTPALPAGKSLVLAEDDDGALSLISDVEGGVVVATTNEDGSVTIQEILSDGSTGDVLTIPAPVAQESAEEASTEEKPEDAA